MTQSTPTGFEGLTSFVTDADAAIAKADRIAAGAPPAPAPRQHAGPPAEAVDRDGGAISGMFKKVGGWVLAIGLILAIKACFFTGSRAVSDGISSSGYEESATQGSDTFGEGSDTTVDNMMVDDATSSADETDENTTGETGQGAEGYAATEIEVDPVVSPTDEEKPSPGATTLTTAEIQYCLAEDFRLTGQKTEMESLQLANPDRFDRNVDGFNSAVSDYNRVCSNRQVVTSQRLTAERNVNGRRYMLEAEGRNRVQ